RPRPVPPAHAGRLARPQPTAAGPAPAVHEPPRSDPSGGSGPPAQGAWPHLAAASPPAAPLPPVSPPAAAATTRRRARPRASPPAPRRPRPPPRLDAAAPTAPPERATARARH